MKYQIAIVSFWLLISGCMSDAKLAKRCTEKFPCVTDSTVVIVRDTVKRDTVFLAPDTTVFVTDTIVCPPSIDTVTHVQTKPCRCPVGLQIIVTFEYDTTRIITKIDSATVFLKQQQIDLLTKQIAIQKNKNQIILWFFLGALAVAIGLLVFMTYFKK